MPGSPAPAAMYADLRSDFKEALEGPRAGSRPVGCCGGWLWAAVEGIKWSADHADYTMVRQPRVHHSHGPSHSCIPVLVVSGNGCRRMMQPLSQKGAAGTESSDPPNVRVGVEHGRSQSFVRMVQVGHANYWAYLIHGSPVIL